MNHINEKSAATSLRIVITDAKDITSYYTSKIAASARATQALFERQNGQEDKTLAEMADLIECLAQILNVEVGAMLGEALQAATSLDASRRHPACSTAFIPADHQPVALSVQ